MDHYNMIKLNPLNLQFIDKKDQTFEICELAILKDHKACEYIKIDMGKYNDLVYKHNKRHIENVEVVPLRWLMDEFEEYRNFLFVKSCINNILNLERHCDTIKRFIKNCEEGENRFFNKMTKEDKIEGLSKMNEVYNDYLTKLHEKEALIKLENEVSDIDAIISIIILGVIIIALFSCVI